MIDTTCLLFIPAKERFLQKLSSYTNDCIIIDLEDSISIKDKEIALNNLVNCLNAMTNINTGKWFIRINKDNIEYELEVLNKFNVGFMLPKTESVEEILKHKHLLRGHCVIALIETPQGLINIQEICSCEAVSAIAFGAEDFTAQLRMKNDNTLLLFAKSRLVTFAKVYQKPVYDTPSFNVTDEDLFKEDVDYSVNLGFDGKLAIHPKQLSYIKDAYHAQNIEHLRLIVKEYEEKGGGAVVIEGNVYEQMHINNIKKILNQ